ncbi:MAG TPA: VCBS repeat-containing protein [Gemmataceae bacterium]|jgi:hypothetical protein|nr:VCBS repeat-containing protein [Gemmataceae bacterium]
MSNRKRPLASGWAALVIAAGLLAGCEQWNHRADSNKRVNDPPPAPKPVMAQSQTEYLWDIESHGNKLARTNFGLKAFGVALSKADRKGLDTILAADFQGEILGKPFEEIHVANDSCDVVRQQEAGSPRRKLDRRQFIQQFLEWRALFHQPPKVGIALMKLSPKQPENRQGPWNGSCQLRMYGDTDPGKPAEVLLYMDYTVPEPTEENLTKPGWLRNASIVQIQIAKSPRYLFHDVTVERGIDPGKFHDNWRPQTKLWSNTGGVYLCDFNRDGILDILVTDLDAVALYQGLPGGKFRDVTTEVGLPTGLPSPAACAVVDLDGDGWEDIILGNQIYRNLEGKRFLDVTPICNLLLPQDSVGIAVADYNRDGLLDIYVTRPGERKKDSWLTGKSGDPNKGNQLWENKGHFRFENVTAKSGTAAGNRSTFSAVWLDANNDGWPDLYVINEFGSGVLLINNQNGTFEEKNIGTGDFGSMGVTCGDIDNDNNIDIYCANMYSKAGSRVIGNVQTGTYPDEMINRMRSFVKGSQLWLNRGDLKFEPVGQKYQISAVGWAYGPALVDLDNDGWLDLYATAGFVSQSRTEPDG